MWPLVGHGPQVAWLKRSLERGNLAHAYLVTGPARTGKMALALALARALNCEADERPCGVCHQCQKIAGASHPDVQIIALGAGVDEDGRSRTEISIKQVRDDIQHWASLPPFEGKYRVFIIDEADFLSSEAANCLLKTLEEPLDKVLFILLTSEPGRLPETVLSRCQRVDLKPVPAEKIEKALLEKGMGVEKARLISRLCHGRPGWALIAASDEALLERRSELLDRLIDMIEGNLEKRFECAAELASRFSQRRAEVQETLDLWLDFWRDLLLIKAGLSEDITNPDYRDKLASLAGAFTLREIRSFVAAMSLAGKHLRQNASPRLVLEVLMLDMPGGAA